MDPVTVGKLRHPVVGLPPDTPIRVRVADGRGGLLSGEYRLADVVVRDSRAGHVLELTVEDVGGLGRPAGG